MKRVIDGVLLGFLPVALWAVLPQTSAGQLNKGIKVNLNNIHNKGSLTIGIYLAGGSLTGDPAQAQQPVIVQQGDQGGGAQQGKGKGKGDQGGGQQAKGGKGKGKGDQGGGAQQAKGGKGKGDQGGGVQQAQGGRDQKKGGDQTRNSLSQSAQMIGHHHRHHHHHHFAHHHHEGMGHEGHSAGMTGHHHHQQHAMNGNGNGNGLPGKGGQSNLLTGGGKGNQAATLTGGGKGNQSGLQTGGGKGNQTAVQTGGKGNQTALQNGGKGGQSSGKAATRTPLSQFQSPITGTRVAANTRTVQSPIANPGTSKGKKK